MLATPPAGKVCSKPQAVQLQRSQDGIPILGPYGRDGRLVNSSELDECNGLKVINEHGEQDVRAGAAAQTCKLPVNTLSLGNTSRVCCKIWPAVQKVDACRSTTTFGLLPNRFSLSVSVYDRRRRGSALTASLLFDVPTANYRR